MCSVILHRDDDKAIGRKALKFELAFGMGITLNCCQVSGMIKFEKRLLRISRRTVKVLDGRFLISSGDIRSKPEATDFLELIADFSSVIRKGEVRN